MNEKCVMFFELSEFTPSSYTVYSFNVYLTSEHQIFRWKLTNSIDNVGSCLTEKEKQSSQLQKKNH